MQTTLEPRAQVAIRPLDIVDTQNQTRFEIALDRLEKELLHYIINQAGSGHILSQQHIRGLFFHTKKAVRR